MKVKIKTSGGMLAYQTEQTAVLTPPLEAQLRKAVAEGKLQSKTQASAPDSFDYELGWEEADGTSLLFGFNEANVGAEILELIDEILSCVSS